MRAGSRRTTPVECLEGWGGSPPAPEKEARPCLTSLPPIDTGCLGPELADTRAEKVASPADLGRETGAEGELGGARWKLDGGAWGSDEDG